MPRSDARFNGSGDYARLQDAAKGCALSRVEAEPDLPELNPLRRAHCLCRRQLPRLLTEIKPHQNIVVVVAKTAAKNVDPAGMLGPLVDADLEAD